MFFSFTLLFATPRNGAVAASGVVLNRRVLPSYENFGEIADTSGNKAIENFTSSLRENFSLEWTEEHFNSDVRRMLSSSSRELANLMPIKNIVYSSLSVKGSTVSFSFSASNEKNDNYEGSAVVENDKIIALTLAKTSK